MARLASDAKLGYYPANPIAVDGILKHLVAKPLDPNRKKSTINILDPCCGKAEALRQIQLGLEVPSETTYAVELDAGRVAEARSSISGAPEGNILGPASFLNVQISGSSFGLIYLNPPFSDVLGGGRREEHSFAIQATRLIVPKGVLVLVAPLKAVCGNRDFVEFLDAHYEDMAVYKFPDGEDADGNTIRPYNEIVIIAKKRGTALPAESLGQFGLLHKMDWRYGYVGNAAIHRLPPLGGVQPVSFGYNGTPSYDREEHVRTWEIPLSWPPHVFKKTAYTEQELAEIVESSPLGKILDEVSVPRLQCPPLPLDRGHLGLLLASGMLNGVVEGPHGPHVIRGGSHKVTYFNKEASESTENPETGAVTTKTVMSERPVTIIRVVESDGQIKTFSNEPKKEDDDGEID